MLEKQDETVSAILDIHEARTANSAWQVRVEKDIQAIKTKIGLR